MLILLVLLLILHTAPPCCWHVLCMRHIGRIVKLIVRFRCISIVPVVIKHIEGSLGPSRCLKVCQIILIQLLRLLFVLLILNVDSGRGPVRAKEKVLGLEQGFKSLLKGDWVRYTQQLRILFVVLSLASPNSNLILTRRFDYFRTCFG